MQPQILRLNKAGQAMAWIDLETAACLYCKDQILWTYGESSIRLHGGIARMTGLPSTLDIALVIATKGIIDGKNLSTPHLSNASLFRRDKFCCMYCGNLLDQQRLTRDHILPRAKGGLDSWTNCISACKPCNNHKGCRTPEEAGMKLLAVPFKPNKSEYLALANRNILADQMAFLTKSFSKNMQLPQ